MRVLAIDPGNEETAYVIWDSRTRQMIDKNKVTNEEFLLKLNYIHENITIDQVAIECVSSYGMAVGQETFDTCIFIGMLLVLTKQLFPEKPILIFRKTIKMHHCGNVRAKDGEVNTYLQQQYGTDNTQKKANLVYWNLDVEKHGGTKYMNGDIWAAFALALYVVEPKDYPIKNLMEKESNKLSKFLLEFTKK